MHPFYRSRQALLSVVLHLAEKRKQPFWLEENALMQLAPELAQRDLRFILLVTTAGMVRRGTLAPFFASLQSHGIAFSVFSDVMPDPTTECVEQGYRLFKEQKCSAIVAIGGGSVLDCAKGIAAHAARPEKTLLQMRGLLQVRGGKNLPPLFAVPTTAGTGSEATAAAVFTDASSEKHYKFAVSDFCLVPRLAVLDPLLTKSLPPQLTAQTGMDAMTHAVEAYINRFASAYVKKTATEAVRLIDGNLYTAYTNGDDLGARKNMLYASYLAGIAFTNNFVGYVHALAHAVGALYGVPHGLANAVLLPAVLREYGAAVTKPLSELASAAGLCEKSEEALADAFIRRIETLCESMRIPDRFSVLRQEDFPLLISRALCEANPDYPVPVIFGESELAEILHAVSPC